jgi:hypothetical protein
MTSLSASRQSEIKAWEEEIISCDHIRNLQQEAEKVVSAGKRKRQYGFFRRIGMICAYSVAMEPSSILRPNLAIVTLV